MVDAFEGLGMFWSIVWMMYWLFIGTNMFKAIILNSTEPDVELKSNPFNFFFRFVYGRLRGRNKVSKEISKRYFDTNFEVYLFFSYIFFSFFFN